MTSENQSGKGTLKTGHSFPVPVHRTRTSNTSFPGKAVPTISKREQWRQEGGGGDVRYIEDSSVVVRRLKQKRVASYIMSNQFLKVQPIFSLLQTVSKLTGHVTRARFQ